MLGAAGLLSLPYPEEFGGGDQPYEVYLQVLEELGARWAAVAVAVSVHGLSCFALATHGTDEQKNAWLPDMLGGNTIGAYSLSEPQAGSDAAALACRATAAGEGDYRHDAGLRAAAMRCCASSPCASEITSSTPDRPRATNPRRKLVHPAP